MAGCECTAGKGSAGACYFGRKPGGATAGTGRPAPLRSGTAQTPIGQTPAAAPTCDPTFPGWPNVTTPTQHWANTGPTPATRHPDLKPHGRHTPPPADTYHRPAPRRPPVTGPTFPQPPRRPNPHRQPPPAPLHWRQPQRPLGGQTFSRRSPLQSSTLQRRSPHLRPPTTGQPSTAAHHRSNVSSAPSATKSPQTAPTGAPPLAAAQRPTGGQTFSRRPPLQSSTHQRRSHHLRPPTTGQPSAAAHHQPVDTPTILPPAAKPHHRPTLGGRPSPTQRPPPLPLSSFGGSTSAPPVTDTTPPLPLPQSPPLGSHYPPRRPLRHFTKRQAKKKPLRREGPESSLNDNPQRGYLFSFRMRIACSRIVVSSNVTMPPSGPGSK